MAQFAEFLIPLIKTDQYTVIPLAGDASSRRYYRIVANKKSWVLMEWEPFEQIGDFPFLSVQKYFDENGIRVPRIHSYSKETGLFLLEDLGDLTLERRFWEFQNQDVVLPFYKRSLDQLIKIHDLSFKHGETICTAYKNEFSVEKLLWEMNYAKKYLLEGLLKTQLSSPVAAALDKEFNDICRTLYQSPQVICHRDFHSRNIMLSYDEVVLIDFQDARLGPPAYDLVSLFFDSYVELSSKSIQELMGYYKDNFSSYKKLKLSEDQWDEYFNLQTIQRCFKACGSFASFKMIRDDNRYLSYLAPTVSTVLTHLPAFKADSELAKILNDNRDRLEDF